MNKIKRSDKPVRVALLGCGTVGSQVARLITSQAEDLRARVGRPLELVGIGVKRLDLQRPGIDPALFTTDLHGLVSQNDLDVVVEVIGGIDPAYELLLSAIEHGASVVTANKALLAEHYDELAVAAEREGVDLYFEAAVAGAIPIIRPLRESLVGDEITTVMGIVNGTTNFILDKMTSTGSSFDEALAQAQALGFAEADPTADVEGYDAAAKAAILASLAFHTSIKGSDVTREGITQVTPDDIEAARGLGCVVKLLATAKLTAEGRVGVKVHPTMVAQTHPLASVSGAYNAVFVECREAGRLMFLGQGAGGAPTASAVMGDVVTVARNRARGVAGHGHSSYTQRAIADPGGSEARYYLRFQVADRPGILAACATLFAQHEVSLQTVRQSALEGFDRADGMSATLGLLTHPAREESLQEVLKELSHADFVGDEVRFMRVEGS